MSALKPEEVDQLVKELGQENDEKEKKKYQDLETQRQRKHSSRMSRGMSWNAGDDINNNCCVSFSRKFERSCTIMGKMMWTGQFMSVLSLLVFVSAWAVFVGGMVWSDTYVILLLYMWESSPSCTVLVDFFLFFIAIIRNIIVQRRVQLHSIMVPTSRTLGFTWLGFNYPSRRKRVACQQDQ